MKKYEIKYWFMVQCGPFKSPRLAKKEIVYAISKQHCINIANDKLIEIKRIMPNIDHFTTQKMTKIKTVLY